MKERPFVARKLLWFALGFLVAALLTVYLDFCTIWIALVFAALAVGLLFVPRVSVRGAAIVLLGAAVGMLWCYAYGSFFRKNIETLDGKTQAFTAVTVGESSKTRYGAQAEALLQTESGAYRSILYFRDGAIGLRPGEEIHAVGSITAAPTSFSQTGDLYNRARGVVYTVRVREIESVTKPEKLPLLCYPALWAQALKDNLRASVPADASGLTVALVTGDRSDISDSLRANMSVAGVYHAISLSGMHVSLLVGILMLLLGRRKLLTALLGIPLICAFVLLSGAAASTVRAAVMQSILLLSPLLRREYDPLTSLSAALVLLIAQNPWCVANWGFQLSFLSTLGILLFVPKLYPILTPKRWRHGFLTAPLRYATGAFSVTLSATVVSGPLLAAYFGVVSIIAPIANILVLWAVTVCFAGGIFVAFAAFLSPAVASAVGWLLAWVFRYLYAVVSALAHLPFAAAYTSAPMLVLAVLAGYLLLFLALLLRVRYWQGACCICAACALCVGLNALSAVPDCITALDVGQGQCIVCIADGAAIVVDCGGEPTSGETAAGYLSAHGITTLDALVLTHFDTDHINGVGALISRVDVKELYVPADAPPSDEQEELLALAADAELPVTFVQTVTELPACGATVYPPLGDETDNESGLCVLASHGGVDALITGDLPDTVERRLLRTYPLPDLEVLVAGHHGSRYSACNSLLYTLQPEVLLISVGKNQYGHPSDSVLRRALKFGAAAYTTLDNGNLTIAW